MSGPPPTEPPAAPEDAAASLPMGHLKAVDTSAASSALDTRKTIIGAIVTVVVLVIIFVGLIPKFGSYADAWDQIQGMTPTALALIGASVLVMLVVYVWPYQAAIPGLPYKPAFVIRQTSFTISNTIPAGGAFGLAIQFAMLSSYSAPVAASTAGIAVTSLWSLLMTLTLPVFGVLAALTTGQVQSQWVWVAVIGIVATVATVVLLWLILRSEQSARRIGDLGNRMLSPVNRRRANPIDAVGMSIDLRNSTKDVVFVRWRWVTVSNYIVILAQFAVLWFAIQGVLGDAPTTLTLAGAFAAFAISRMASMIPVTPGGLGTVDAALIALLTTFGLTNDEAVASALVWRACSWIPQVCLGVVTFLYWRMAQARAGRVVRA
jgi:putative heme transporter